MGQFTFECCGECGGNKEQFDWTPTVVVALPVGKDGADVHFRAEYNSYGNFFLRVVPDGDKEKKHVGEYDSLGHVVRPCCAPELSTLIVTQPERCGASDGFVPCSACYCFGAFVRSVGEDEDEDEDEDKDEDKKEIGTRFCAPSDVRIFMGITLTELAKLHPKEAEKIRAAPPDTDSNSFGGVGAEIELAGFTMSELRQAAKGHFNGDGGLDRKEISKVLRANGDNAKALLTNMHMFAPNGDKGKLRSVVEKRLQALLNAMDNCQNNEDDESTDDESKDENGEENGNECGGADEENKKENEKEDEEKDEEQDEDEDNQDARDAAGQAFARAMGIPIHNDDGTIEDYGIKTQVGVGLQRRQQHGLSAGRLVQFHPISKMGWAVQYCSENDAVGESLGESFSEAEELHPALHDCWLHMYPHMAEECPPADEQGSGAECVIM